MSRREWDIAFDNALHGFNCEKAERLMYTADRSWYNGRPTAYGIRDSIIQLYVDLMKGTSDSYSTGGLTVRKIGDYSIEISLEIMSSMGFFGD